MIIKKSHRLLGFISRNRRDFTNKLTIKSLYSSLIRPIWEYGSIVWSPGRQEKKQDRKKYSTNSYATSHLNVPYLENLTHLTIHSYLY